MIPELHISDYNYNLPEGRIAKYPLEKRDSSKLLSYDSLRESIEDHVFTDLPTLLPADSIMVFNDTKVVPARLHFVRPTGAHIEIFCLKPIEPAEYNTSFASTNTCRWQCIVGNSKRWKNDVLSLYNPENDERVAKLDLKASLIEKIDETAIVEFIWSDGSAFSRVLEICGTIPIPPYLKRSSEAIDKERYQTLYAKFRGSVAAPTAGLHFTERVLNEIKTKGIDMQTVCLHVGAGTFLPVKDDEVSRHEMHREPFVVGKKFLEDILGRKKKIIAVGTTSVRTLESLYYVGAKCIENGKPSDVTQWEPYERDWPYTMDEALEAILKYLNDNNLDELSVGTRIIIVPGFEFRLTDIMVTNFHQPQSTLLLLVSAFIGGNWKPIYDHALSGGYRFLSYGDSSVLTRKK